MIFTPQVFKVHDTVAINPYDYAVQSLRMWCELAGSSSVIFDSTDSTLVLKGIVF